ncbi:MAG: GlsB/YeaQ/YmgE family stress response membrane protein [Bacillota bacterium]
MSIFLWIVFGALVGWIANMFMKKGKGGLIRNIIVGLLGAVIGGFIGSFFGLGEVNTFTIEGFLVSIGGAVLLLFILNKLKI